MVPMIPSVPVESEDRHVDLDLPGLQQKRSMQVIAAPEVLSRQHQRKDA